MDNGTSTNRVEAEYRYLAYRQVRAVEQIAVLIYSFQMFVYVAIICCSAAYLLTIGYKSLRGKKL
jgi:hypothetical protein